MRGDGRVSAKDDFDGPRPCPEGEAGAGPVEKYPVSSSCGWRRREGELRYAGRGSRGDSLESRRLDSDIAFDVD